MDAYSILKYVIWDVVYFLETWMLYRSYFRFRDYVSVGFVMLMYIMEDCAYYITEWGTLSDVMIHYCFVLLGLIPFQRNKIVRMLIIQILYLFVFNVIGSISMVICTTGYSLIAGTSNETWMASSISTSMDDFFHYTLLIPVSYVACLIARKGLPLIEKLTDRERLLLMLGTAMPNYAFYAFKLLVAEEVSDYYGGIVVILYGLLMAWVALCLILFIETVLIRLSGERKELQVQMELQKQQYEKIRNLQDGVRELRHDLINHLAVRTISKEDVQDLIGNCRKTIEEIGKDDR